MILREAQIDNFRQLTGRNKIRFAPPGDRSVTVILGENGAGKTTLLHAFQWCLYGERDFENPSDLVSYMAIEDASPGRKVRTSVRLVLEAQGCIFTIERTLEGIRRDGGKLDQLTEDLRVDKMDSAGATSQVKDTKTQIEQMLPKALAGFFFFRGEDLESLVAQAGADKLKDAVERFVDLVVLDRSIRDLRKVEKELERRMVAATAGEAHELTTAIDEVSRNIELANSDFDEARREQSQLLELREANDSKLALIDEIRPLVEERRSLDQAKEALERQREEHRTKLARTVSRNGYLYLRSDALTVGARLSDEARRKGDLPAKIKPQFVDDLLAEGVCCCGTTIDDEMRGLLASWKDTESNQLAALESAISGLSSDLRHLEGRARQFKVDYDDARIGIAGIDEELRETDEKLSAVTADLDGKSFEEQTSRRYQDARRILEDSLIAVGVKLSRLADRQKDLEDQHEKFLAARKKAMEAVSKAAKIGRQIDAVRKVRGGLERLRLGWISIVQKYLDAELKKTWTEMAQLERLVEFDQDFRLNIKERGGDGEWRKSASSSANQRALALGFVASLIRLADAARHAESQWFQGGRYPLVMDAPFATMDTHFKTTVPAGLRRVVPQLVLATNYDQWDGEVEASLGGAVGAAYILELHKPGESNRTVRFRDQMIDYVVGEVDAAFDWSQVQEVQ